MFTLAEAELIGNRWVAAGTDGPSWRLGIEEFDLGYVVWPVAPPGEQLPIGVGRAVIDRETGELSLWPAMPVPRVIEMYEEDRARRPAAPRTWDPAARNRRDLDRTTFPETITHLTLPTGRLQISRSMKGDGRPDLHPLVRDFLDELPVRKRERGADRCAEVAALSDALHRESADRAAAGRPDITLDEARSDLFGGADLVTYWLREPTDPRAGRTGPPCVSCLLLLRHLGFQLRPTTEV